jgi:CelD/BcsL family acetyltransferase involved in cellulose biosynthesis
MIDVIDTLEKMEALEEEWTRLEQNPEMRIFQTYAWCRYAWEHCVSKENGVRLWILRWSQAGRKDTVIFLYFSLNLAVF